MVDREFGEVLTMLKARIRRGGPSGVGPTPEELRATTSALTQLVIDKVTTFANKRAAMLIANGVRAARLEGKAIAQDAITDTIAGGLWSPGSGLTLEGHLIGLVRQRTWDRLRRHRRRPHVSVDDSRDGLAVRKAVAASATTSDPDAAIDARQTVERVVAWMRERAPDDIGLQALATAYELGVTNRAEIAALAGMTAKEVTYARVRFERLLPSLRADLDDSSHQTRSNP